MIFTFRDFTFPVNPQSLRIDDPGRAQAHALALEGYRVQILPTAPAEVTGSGVFTGPQAQEYFRRMRREFLRGGHATLIPGAYRSMEAVWSALACTGRQGESVEYAFTFIEFPVLPCPACGVLHRVDMGETLWDVSAAYGVGIRRLMALNPGLCAPDAVREGEEVRIC